MQFNFSTILVALTVASSVTATPTRGNTPERDTETSSGECNGTSCQVGFDNFECNRGSCAGPDGGDGKFCTVVDNQDGSRTTFCPGCKDQNLC
ncbi:hypothetical protein GGS26DRAFT_589130 [Hypomontagnella submonticulosa]|nr:hypothetical protein GGS26DRAFT_589130 [Hypomontagnella submonticulosa]